MVLKFSSHAAEAAYWKSIVDRQVKLIDEASARLRAAWIERERLRALLTAHGIDIGTPTPDSVPISGSSR